MPTEAEEREERMAAETLDKRATTLHHLHVATSLVLALQCSPFTYLISNESSIISPFAGDMQL